MQAVLTGVETARELCAGGVRLLAAGEMGIGNTTTSSAVAAVLLGQEPVVMTGRGPACPTRACRRRSTPSRPPWR